jgi:hypothetical protein
MEVSPRHWIESKSKIEIADEHGPLPQNRKKALQSCMTYGVSGGYNAEAAGRSLRLIEQDLARLHAPR